MEMVEMGSSSSEPMSVKVVILGEATVGKSSLALRFQSDRFYSKTMATVGAAFTCRTLGVDLQTVKFQIWDTAGSLKYHTLAPMYYRGAAAAIVVYDITSLESFDRAEEWVQELQECGPDSMIIALVGNKSDIVSSDASLREVPRKAASQHAEELGCHTFAETSALSGEGVTELFRTIARRVAEGELAHVKVEGMAEPTTVRSCCAGKKHTEYTLRLQTTGGGGVESRCIRTRYKSIAQLHRKLSKSVQGLPALPPKVWNSRRRFAGATVEAREQGFTTFLRHALARCKDSPLLQEFIERNEDSL